jgi:hypothetical protein
MIHDWPELVQLANNLDIGDALGTTYLFRGQEDFGWTLQPSLHRAALNDMQTPLPPAEELVRFESVLTSEFRAVSPNHLRSAMLPVAPYTDIDWWPLMRHYGVPTRLLDWTRSFYVALYFACSRLRGKDGAVYVLHGHTLGLAMKAAHGDAAELPTFPAADGQFRDPASPSILNVFTLKTLVDRMIAQQGVFMVSRNIAANIEEVLADELPKADRVPTAVAVEKLRIPASLKPEVMRRLRSMNVTGSSLFPGLDGVGRHLDELIRWRT